MSKQLTTEQKIKRANYIRNYMRDYYKNHPNQAEKNRIRSRERMRKIYAAKKAENLHNSE